MVRTEKWQCGQYGGSSLKSKCRCVILVWPILKRVIITSFFLGVQVGQREISGLISFNLLLERLSHSLCHLFLRSIFIVCFKSGYGTGQFKMLQPCLAALSAASLPLIPICPGTQQKRILNPFFVSSV